MCKLTLKTIVTSRLELKSRVQTEEREEKVGRLSLQVERCHLCGFVERVRSKVLRGRCNEPDARVVTGVRGDHQRSNVARHAHHSPIEQDGPVRAKVHAKEEL